MSTMDAQVETVRRFNRFYTRYVGALQTNYLKSPFSLAEGRVLYELAHKDQMTATEIGKALQLDNGYLSRILQKFAQRGLVRRGRSKTDARQSPLSLTSKGRDAIASLDRRQHEEVAATLGTLSEEEKERLGGAMRTIEEILNHESKGEPPYTLRSTLQAGDIGWAIERHGVLYAREYGWNEQCEGLIAEIAADFVKNFDAERERCWIAERNGVRVGCVFLVKKSATVAQLRMLLVEPSARGLGIGKRLVRECVEFARQAGYRKIMLWTNDVLETARHLYQANGFQLIKEERHHSFGQDLVGQYWERSL